MSDSTRAVKQAVLEGQVSERDTVVYVRKEGGDLAGSCSGTMVAPNVVLTARHCVAAFTNGDYSCTLEGDLDLTQARSPATAGDMGLVLPPENVTIFTGQAPDFNSPVSRGREIFAPHSNTICRNDVAFVVLEDAITTEYESMRLGRGVTLNEKVGVIGYGTNDIRKTQRFERFDLPILAIGVSEFYPIEGQAVPRSFVLGRSVCPGDSGGPAIAQEDNQVVGVFSFISGTCTSSEVRNFFSHIASYEEFARAAFEEAGHSDLLPEPEAQGTGGTEPNPEGEAGAAGAPSAPGDSRSASSDSGGCHWSPSAQRRPSSDLQWLLTSWASLFVMCLVMWMRRRRRGAARLQT